MLTVVLSLSIIFVISSVSKMSEIIPSKNIPCGDATVNSSASSVLGTVAIQGARGKRRKKSSEK